MRVGQGLLSRTPFEGFPQQALKGEQVKGLFKARVGDWHLVYKVGNGEVRFITFGHRSEVYR